VLAKPFERLELVRSVSSAWLHWYHKYFTPELAVLRATG
jgi:hypothetical protein